MDKQTFYKKLDINNVLKIVNHICNKHESSDVPYKKIIDYYVSYAKKQEVEDFDLEEVSKLLDAKLEELNRKKYLSLKKKGDSIDFVVCVSKSLNILKKVYQELLDTGRGRFPSSEEGKYKNIPFKEDDSLEEILKRREGEHGVKELKETAYAIKISKDIRKILVLSSYLDSKLLQIALQKVKDHLQLKVLKNMIKERLETMLPKDKYLIKEFVLKISTTMTVESFLSSKNNSFAKMIQMLYSIIQSELKKETTIGTPEYTRLEELLISSFIMKAYSSLTKFNKTNALKKKEMHTVIQLALKKEPFLYELEQIEKLTLKNGTSLSENLEQDELKILLATSNFFGSLTIDKVVYYYLYYSIPVYLIKTSKEIKTEFEKYYKRSWVQSLNNKENLNTMKSDEEFEENLKYRLKTYYPIVYAVLDYNILHQVRNKKEVTEKGKDYAISLIDNENRAVNYSIFLNLKRSNILQYAQKNSMKIFQIPLIGGLLKILLGGNRKFVEYDGQKVLSKKPKKEKKKTDNKNNTTIESKTSKKEKVKERTKASFEKNRVRTKSKSNRDMKIDKLKEEFLSSYGDSTLDKILKDLEKQWNPLIVDPGRKRLKEDIDALCKDIVRNIKKKGALYVPEVEDIQNRAERIAGDSKLNSITDKKHFKEYIQIQIIKKFI